MLAKESDSSEVANSDDEMATGTLGTKLDVFHPEPESFLPPDMNLDDDKRPVTDA